MNQYQFVQSPREFVMTGEQKHLAAKRWVFTVLAVPGIAPPSIVDDGTGPPSHCPLSPVARYTYNPRQDTVGLRVFVPSSAWLITQSSTWQVQVHVGTSPIWPEREAFELFEAVCAMAGEFGLVHDPEIASAIRTWFLNKMATLASSTVTGLAIADVGGEQIGLQSLAIDTQTGKCYAQMTDGTFVTPEGETVDAMGWGSEAVVITLPTQ